MNEWIEETARGHKARIRLDDGTSRSKTFPTVREARAWLWRSRTEMTDGTFIPEASGKMPFSEWVSLWRSTVVDLAPNPLNRRNSDLKNWVLPAFESKRRGAITQPDVKTWIATMHHEGCSAGSIKLRYETLSTIMRAAVDAELIRRSPCHHIGLPRYEALILVAGTGGLRIGELGALRGRRVDLVRGSVDVAENLLLDNGTPRFGPLKTKAGRRRVPLPRQTVEAEPGRPSM